jgi:hypothetical protein
LGRFLGSSSIRQSGRLGFGLTGLEHFYLTGTSDDIILQTHFLKIFVDIFSQVCKIWGERLPQPAAFMIEFKIFKSRTNHSIDKEVISS